MIPNAVAILGKAISIQVQSGDEIYEYAFKRKHIFVSDGAGKRIWIFPVQKTGKTSKKPSQSTMLRVADRYSDFTDFDPNSVEQHKVTESKLKPVGRLLSIVYESNKWTGKSGRYIHDFKTPPLVKMDNDDDPKMIEISGGKLRIKPEGIIG